MRPLTVFGYDDAPHGHALTHYRNVVVSSAQGILGGRANLGRGFVLAQSRLGPGRLHHCARLVGHGERAVEEINSRGRARQAFGKSLLDLGGNGERLARCRVGLRLSMLAVVDAARQLDLHEVSTGQAHRQGGLGELGGLGRGGPAKDRLPDSALVALAVVKVSVPHAIQECLDFAVQIHGGGGLSNDHPLAAFWAAARTLRLVDGPDEVHLRTLAKLERGAARGGERGGDRRDHRGGGRSSHVDSLVPPRTAVPMQSQSQSQLQLQSQSQSQLQLQSQSQSQSQSQPGVGRSRL